MKEYYKVTYTIEQGEYEYHDSIGILGLDFVPSSEDCLEIAMKGFFPDHMVGIAMKQYQLEGYVLLPDGERIIKEIDYAHDFYRMVQHATRDKEGST